MTGGLAMGLMEDFGYASRREVLRPGETLFLYTDGLTDANKPQRGVVRQGAAGGDPERFRGAIT